MVIIGEVRVAKIKEGNSEKEIYAASMPTSTESIFYSNARGCYVWCCRDENGKVVKQREFGINVAISNSKIELDQMTGDNFKQYTLGQGLYERGTEGEIIMKLDTDSIEGKKASLVVTLDDGTFIKSTAENMEKKSGFLDGMSDIWNSINSSISWVVDGIIDKLAKIINDLLLDIADGIQALIDMVMKTDRVTVRDVIFGNLPQLSINFWETSSITNNDANMNGDTVDVSIDTPPVSVLKGIVSYWYGVLRKIAIAIYLVMLLYIGVRILLSSTGKGASQFKESLTSWVVGVIILMFFPIVMRYIILINQSFVEMLDTNVVDINSGEAGREDDAMLAVRNMAESYENLALTIVYIIMLGQLVVLLGVYYKRVIVISFLITIFPIVATLYIWEKTNKGHARSLGTWAKEFTILVFTQTFHAVVYVILIDGAFSAFLQLIGKNWLLFILSVTFLFQA